MMERKAATNGILMILSGFGESIFPSRMKVNKLK